MRGGVGPGPVERQPGARFSRLGAWLRFKIWDRILGRRAVVIQWRWGWVVVFALGVSIAFAASPAGKPGADTVSFQTWREPNEGAYTIEVPRGWQVSGGVRRQTPVDVRS